MAAAAITSLQAGETRGISTGILFYIYFIPLYFCVTDASEVSISESLLLIESLKLELHIRSCKIPSVILGQSKSETRSSLENFFSEARAAQCGDIEDNIWPLPEANITAAHCTCLKTLSTQAPYSVLSWLSIIMSI